MIRALTIIAAMAVAPSALAQALTPPPGVELVRNVSGYPDPAATQLAPASSDVFFEANTVGTGGAWPSPVFRFVVSEAGSLTWIRAIGGTFENSSTPAETRIGSASGDRFVLAIYEDPAEVDGVQNPWSGTVASGYAQLVGHEEYYIFDQGFNGSTEATDWRISAMAFEPVLDDAVLEPGTY